MMNHIILSTIAILLVGCSKQEQPPARPAAEDVALAAAEAMVNLDEQSFVALLDSPDEKDRQDYKWLFSEESFIYLGMKNLQKENPKFAVVYRGSTWPTSSDEAPEGVAAVKASAEILSSGEGELVDSDGNACLAVIPTEPGKGKYEDRYFDTYCFVDGKMGLLIPLKIVKKDGAWFVDKETMRDLCNGEAIIPPNLYKDSSIHRPARLMNSPEQIFAEKSAMWCEEVELADVNYGMQFTPDMYDERSIVVDVRSVDKQGRHLRSGLICSVDELHDTIRNLMRNPASQEPKIIIRADFEAKHIDIAKVMNAATSAGVWKFYIMGLEESAQARQRLNRAGRSYRFMVKENTTSFDKFSLLVVDRPAPSSCAMFEDEDEEGVPLMGYSAQNYVRIDIGRRNDSNPQGVIVYNKKALGGDSQTMLTELDGCLEELAKTSKDVQIEISCTCDSPHKALVDVLDLCYKHGLKNISLFTM